MSEIHQTYLDTFFRCIVTENSFCDEMITDHMLAYIFFGEMILIKKGERTVIKSGEAVFLRRNHLVKKIKQPNASGEPFKGVFLHLNTALLKRMASENFLPIAKTDSDTFKAVHIPLPRHSFLEGFFLSLDHYFTDGQYPSKELIEAKLREAVLILLELNPGLNKVLFDFLDPWKVDIKDFMNENFMCNLTIEQFAHYTGRSLSSFKREFAQLYNETPNRWLIKRRLEEAYTIMAEEKQMPSDVYLKVGFKNISHFSTAFRKQFGITPSVLRFMNV